MDAIVPGASASDSPPRIRGYVATVLGGLAGLGAVSAVATQALILIVGLAAVDCVKAAPAPAECTSDPLRFRTLLIGPALLALYGISVAVAVAVAVRLVRADAALETGLAAVPMVLVGFFVGTLFESVVHLPHGDLRGVIAVSLALTAARWLAVTRHPRRALPAIRAG